MPDPDALDLFADLPEDAKRRAQERAQGLVQHFVAVKARLAEVNPEAVLFDGYDDALIGIVSRMGMDPVALYDRDRCIEILMRRDGMSWESAEEFFQFNTEGCWAGDGTPAFAVLGV